MTRHEETDPALEKYRNVDGFFDPLMSSSSSTECAFQNSKLHFLDFTGQMNSKLDCENFGILYEARITAMLDF